MYLLPSKIIVFSIPKRPTQAKTPLNFHSHSYAHCGCPDLFASETPSYIVPRCTTTISYGTMYGMRSRPLAIALPCTTTHCAHDCHMHVMSQTPPYNHLPISCAPPSGLAWKFQFYLNLVTLTSPLNIS